MFSKPNLVKHRPEKLGGAKMSIFAPRNYPHPQNYIYFDEISCQWIMGNTNSICINKKCKEYIFLGSKAIFEVWTPKICGYYFCCDYKFLRGPAIILLWFLEIVPKLITNLHVFFKLFLIVNSISLCNCSTKNKVVFQSRKQKDTQWK